MIRLKNVDYDLNKKVNDEDDEYAMDLTLTPNPFKHNFKRKNPNPDL